ncbi:hypothetical protein [Algibacter pacificus]|uniref:hypothetical protein n=1 Tax=Algibacter pacificus TaxID=2599389 RepID=UPI0011CB3F0A|nr:hypothetical protein [Algibacter pacificus]
MRIITFIFLLGLFSSCKKSKPLEVWNLSQILYKKTDLLADKKKKILYDAVPLYIDYESNWIVIELEPKIKGKFKAFYEEDGYFYMDIDNFNDKRFNGEYVITIDTIRSSSTSSEIRMIMESNDTYLLGYKSLFKGI